MSLPGGWLQSLAASSTALEQLTRGAAGGLGAPVSWCPGVTVGDVLGHLGTVHRLVRRWVLDAHRPAQPEAMPAGRDPADWFATGWRPLRATLTVLDPRAEASSWCSYDTTAGFWWRRVAHETAIHAAEVHDALGRAWSVPDDVAVDGVDEALRLWLGTQLGPHVGGSGEVVRVVAGERFWTVALNDHNVEVNHIDVPAVATVSGSPVAVYRWMWGRAADDTVEVDGDRAAVVALRSALARTMQ